MPEYFNRYIELAPNEPINRELLENNENNENYVIDVFSKNIDKENYAYASGKWTIKQIMQHIIDTERVMAYRILCMARGDKYDFPGYDENQYAEFAKVTDRNIPELLKEFHHLRQSNILMLESFDYSDYFRSGIVWGKGMCVISLAYVVVGHPIHHINVINERY